MFLNTAHIDNHLKCFYLNNFFLVCRKILVSKSSFFICISQFGSHFYIPPRDTPNQERHHEIVQTLPPIVGKGDVSVYMLT